MANDLFQAIISEQPVNINNLSQAEIRSFIVQNLQRQTLAKQHGSVGPNPPADLEKFYELLGQALVQQQQKDGETHPVPLVEEYPPVYGDQGIGGFKETISFALRRREPGTISQDQPFSGKKNYKPILRETFPDPDNPGYVIMVFGQVFDNLIELKCWATTNKQANYRANWLEDLMLKYAWFFRYYGLNQIFYGGREADGNLKSSDILLQFRTLLYYLRTEKLYTIREKTIDELIVDLQLATPDELATASY